jgi:hypothetical protein
MYNINDISTNTSLNPISLTFEDLVRATTCPEFDLDKLDLQAKAAVLRAALISKQGTSTEGICNNLPEEVGKDIGNGWIIKSTDPFVVEVKIDDEHIPSRPSGGRTASGYG